MLSNVGFPLPAYTSGWLLQSLTWTCFALPLQIQKQVAHQGLTLKVCSKLHLRDYTLIPTDWQSAHCQTVDRISVSKNITETTIFVWQIDLVSNGLLQPNAVRAYCKDPCQGRGANLLHAQLYRFSIHCQIYSPIVS